MNYRIEEKLVKDSPRSNTGSCNNRFYVTMASASAVGVFLGFARSYYLKSYFQTAQLPFLIHIHAAIFTTWFLFFVLQTALISNKRVYIHRRLGYAGAILASAVVILGVRVSFWMVSVGHFHSVPFVHDPEGACLFTLGEILMFAVFVGAGFQFRHNREIHQRAMLMATSWALAPSGLGRFGSLISPLLPVILIYTFVLAGPLYDLITRRRVHPAYIWGLPTFFLFSPPIIVVLGKTQGWHAFVHWVMG
jgi:hypothetical protein